MKKVLIISQHGWPPKNNAQILRLTSLAKHLPEHGWKPIVVARRMKRYDTKDFELAGEVKEIKTYFYRGYLPFRARIAQILKWFFIPDVFFIDLMWNFRKIKKIIEKEMPDVIFVSTPSSGHIIGAILSKKFNIPLVIDYADPWTTSVTYRPSTLFHRIFEKNIERKTVRRSSEIAGTSEMQLKKIKEEFSCKKYHWIPNGFEERIYKKIRPKKDNITTFLYAGTIYGEFDLSFLKIFEEIYETRKDLGGMFTVRFVGSIAPKKMEEISRFKGKFVEIRGRVSRNEFIEELILTDALIFSRSSGFDVDFMPSRIPEYIRAMKPIMAFIRKDTLISEIITKTDTGFIFEKGEEKKAKEFIIKAINGEIKVKPNMEYIMQFEWSNIAKKLADMLEGALNE